VPRCVTTRAVRSYRTFSPLPAPEALAVCFLWHFPWALALQALPGALPDGARTFLRDHISDHSDCLADSYFLEPRIISPVRTGSNQCQQMRRENPS